MARIERSFIVSRVSSAKLVFGVDELALLLGDRPHPVIPPSCFRAEIVVEPNDAVQLNLQCYCDKETLKQFAPELLTELQKKEW